MQCWEEEIKLIYQKSCCCLNSEINSRYSKCNLLTDRFFVKARETVLWCILSSDLCFMESAVWLAPQCSSTKLLPPYQMRKASSSLLSTAEHMSSDPWSALTRSQKICGPATPSFPQSESWWCFLVWELHSPQDFPFSPLHSDFPSVPPFSSDPWICKVIMGRKDTYWHCVGSPLKLFKVEFPVTVVVKPCHHSFHLNDRKPFLFLFTWVGVIVLFIIWNSFLVMNPSLSLSSACKARHITMNCELT